MATTECDYINVGGNGKCDEILASELSTSSFATIPIGFIPSVIVLYLSYNSAQPVVIKYDVANSKVYRTMGASYNYDLTSSFLNTYIYMDGTNLKYKASTSEYVKNTTYIAVG